MSTQTQSDVDLALGRKIVERIAEDVGMMTDAEILVEEVESQRAESRVAGAKTIHISFKLACSSKSELRFGCVLLPLAEAVTLSAMLMVVSESGVDEQRARTDLDPNTKEAMLEVGSFVSASVAGVVRAVSPELGVQFAGCQGVRPGVRPAFPHAQGDELVVIRARLRVGKYPAFQAIVMLPGFPALGG